ncbi:unnamed protein product [Rhodiola kirilowii]
MSGSSAGLDLSPSSSTDSSSGVCFPSLQHSTDVNPFSARRQRKRDPSSDLKHGFRISWPSVETNDDCCFSSSIGIATIPTNRNKDVDQSGQPSFLFVKVYMEGVPIGRKLDLYALHSYNDLLATLSDMFGVSIYIGGFEDTDAPIYNCRACSINSSILTYEDKDGDWMAVGDVPWE